MNAGSTASANCPRSHHHFRRGESWVGGLIQGEGCIESHYVKSMDSTAIQLAFGMTDPEPIFKLCDLVGLSRPSRTEG